MSECERKLPGGSLYYETADEGGPTVCITHFDGSAGEVRIPERIDGRTVTAIAARAFLSRKTLWRVVLPRTVCEIGDWAFAHCTHLAEVRWSGAVSMGQEAPVRFGKAVFRDCRSLRSFYARDGRESTAALLAAAATRMSAEYLVDCNSAGSPGWLAGWDARMQAILHTSDSEGFSDQMVCGEEDVGNSDQAAYESAQRCAKVRLLLLRLLYPDGLDAKLRADAAAYLREHDETRQVILREHAEDPPWYHLFADIGCIDAKNMDAILADIGEEHPEMKAYFLRRRMAGEGSGRSSDPSADFFAGLEL